MIYPFIITLQKDSKNQSMKYFAYDTFILYRDYGVSYILKISGIHSYLKEEKNGVPKKFIGWYVKLQNSTLNTVLFCNFFFFLFKHPFLNVQQEY